MQGGVAGADSEAAASCLEDVTGMVDGGCAKHPHTVDKAPSIGSRGHPGLPQPKRAGPCLASKLQRMGHHSVQANELVSLGSSL